VVASGGYVAYDEANGGRWLYDPGQLTAARNKFFGLLDFGTLYEVQQEYGESDEEGVGVMGTEDIDPSEIETVAGVGSMSVSGDNGVPTSVFSAGVSGTFDADPINEAADEGPMFDEVDEPPVDDHRFWEADLRSDSGGSEETSVQGESSSPIEDDAFQPQSLALGVDQGQMVAGTVRAPEADDVTATRAVETMIRSKRSGGGVNGPDLLTGDDQYESIRSQFDSDPTFLFGGLLDPALVTMSVAATDIVLGFAGDLGGPAGGVTNAVSVFLEQWLEDLRGGAIGGTVDMQNEQTTTKTFLTYTTEDAARQTGIVQIVNAATSEAEGDGIEEASARYEGRNVVVTITADNETVFETDADEVTSGVETPITGSRTCAASLDARLRLSGPLRLHVAVSDHDRLTVRQFEAALPKSDCGERPGDIRRSDGVSGIEIGVFQEVDAGDGVRYHLGERVGDAECDEPGRSPQTRRDSAHPDDVQEDECDREPHEGGDDDDHEVGDELLVGGIRTRQRGSEERPNDADDHVGDDEKDEAGDDVGKGNEQSVGKRAHRVADDVGRRLHTSTVQWPEVMDCGGRSRSECCRGCKAGDGL